MNNLFARRREQLMGFVSLTVLLLLVGTLLIGRTSHRTRADDGQSCSTATPASATMSPPSPTAGDDQEESDDQDQDEQPKPRDCACAAASMTPTPTATSDDEGEHGDGSTCATVGVETGSSATPVQPVASASGNSGAAHSCPRGSDDEPDAHGACVSRAAHERHAGGTQRNMAASPTATSGAGEQRDDESGGAEHGNGAHGDGRGHGH